MKGLRMLGADGFGRSQNNVCKWLLDSDDYSVKVLSVSGTKPYARAFIAAIIDCPEVKEKIKTFLTESDDSLYKMDVYEGVSGCMDLTLKTASFIRGFEVIRSKKLLHITMYSKVDRDFYKFSLRELIEIARYFDLLLPQDRVEACEGVEVSYFNPQRVDSDFLKGGDIIVD